MISIEKHSFLMINKHNYLSYSGLLEGIWARVPWKDIYET